MINPDKSLRYMKETGVAAGFFFYNLIASFYFPSAIIPLQLTNPLNYGIIWHNRT
jgi:hypothetical protein